MGVRGKGQRTFPCYACQPAAQRFPLTCDSEAFVGVYELAASQLVNSDPKAF